MAQSYFNEPPETRGPIDPAALPARRTSPMAIALAWLVVSIPTAWGVTQTARTSAKLFRSSAPAATAPAPTLPANH